MDAFPQICKKKKLLVTLCMLSFARAIKLISHTHTITHTHIHT
jgi:hypothetical protein